MVGSKYFQDADHQPEVVWPKPEPELEPKPNTWTTFRIYSSQDGKATVDWVTNDDNDDGYPDDEITSDTYHFPCVAGALEFTGMTRIGLYGQPVTVYLDGDKI